MCLRSPPRISAYMLRQSWPLPGVSVPITQTMEVRDSAGTVKTFWSSPAPVQSKPSTRTLERCGSMCVVLPFMVRRFSLQTASKSLAQGIGPLSGMLAPGALIVRFTADREFYTFRPIAFDAIRGAMLMGSQDGRVYAWDLGTRQRIAVSPPQSAYVDTLAVSTNGWVAFAGFGKELQLWNPDTGQRRSLPAARPTSNLVPDPDGASIIFGTADGAIEWWNVTAERRLRSMKIPGT